MIAADWPLGPVVSGVTVKVASVESPAPFTALAVWSPEAELEDDQSYVISYGLEATSPPPLIPATDGKVTFAIPDSASAGVAVAVKLPEFDPCGL